MGRKFRWIAQPTIGRRYPEAFAEFLDFVATSLDNGHIVEYRDQTTGERYVVCVRKSASARAKLYKVALPEGEEPIQLSGLSLDDLAKLEEQGLKEEMLAESANAEKSDLHDQEECSCSNSDIAATRQAWGWESATLEPTETATVAATGQKESELSDLMLQLQVELSGGGLDQPLERPDPPEASEQASATLNVAQVEEEAEDIDIDILAADWESFVVPQPVRLELEPEPVATIQIEIEEVAPRQPVPTLTPSPVDAIQQQAQAIAQFANELYDAWKLIGCAESDGPDAEPWGKEIEIEQIYRTSFTQMDGTYFVLQLQQAHAMKLTPRFQLVSIPGANLQIGDLEAGAIAYPAPEKLPSKQRTQPISVKTISGRQNKQTPPDRIREVIAQMGDAHFATTSKTSDKIHGLNWLKRFARRK